MNLSSMDGLEFSVCSCFFFSSRRRHTRYWRDWSSDVCSSDLEVHALQVVDDDVGGPAGGPLGDDHPGVLGPAGVQHLDPGVGQRVGGGYGGAVERDRKGGGEGKGVDLGGRRFIKKKKLELSLH